MHFLNLRIASDIVAQIRESESHIAALQGTIKSLNSYDRTGNQYKNIPVHDDDVNVIRVIFSTRCNTMIADLVSAYDKLDKLDHQYDETTDGF